MYPVDDQISSKHGSQLAEAPRKLDGSVAAMMPPSLPKRSSSSRDAGNHTRNHEVGPQTTVVGTFDGIVPDQRRLRIPAQAASGVANQSGARLADFPTELVYEGRSSTIARSASSNTPQQQSPREPRTAYDKLKGNQKRFAQYVLASIEAGTPPSDAFDARYSRWHVPTMWQQVQRRRRTEAQLHLQEQRAAAYMAGETEDTSRYTQSLEENARLESGVPIICPSEGLALREDILQTRKELLDRRVRSVNSVLSLVRRGSPVDDSVVCYGRGGMKQMPESVSDRTRQLLHAHAEAGTFQARLLTHDKEYAPGYEEDDAAAGGTSAPSIGDRIQAAARLSWVGPARARSRSTGSSSVVSQAKLMRLRQIVRCKHSASSYSPDGGSMYEVDDATGEAVRGAGAAGELVHPHAKLLAVAAAGRGSPPAPDGGGDGGGDGGQVSSSARNYNQSHSQKAGADRSHASRGETGSNKRQSASLMLEGLVDSPVPSTATAAASGPQYRHGAWRHRRPARRRVGAVSSADAFLSGTSAVPEYGYKRARASSRMELDVHELRHIRDSLRRRVAQHQQQLLRGELEDTAQPGQTDSVSSVQHQSMGIAQSASPPVYPLSRIKLPTASPLAVKWDPDQTRSPLQLQVDKQTRELVQGQSLQDASRDARAQRIASLVYEHVLAQLRQPPRLPAGQNELTKVAAEYPSELAAYAANSSKGSMHQTSGGVRVTSPLTRPPSDPHQSSQPEVARPEGPNASNRDQEAIASPLKRPGKALDSSPERSGYHAGKSRESDGQTSGAPGLSPETLDTSYGYTSPGTIEPTSPIQRHSQRGIGVDAVIHAVSSSRHPPEIPGGISAMAAQLGVSPATRGRGGPVPNGQHDRKASMDASYPPALYHQAQLRAVLQEALPEVFEMRRELAEARLEIYRLKAQQYRDGQNGTSRGGTDGSHGSYAGPRPQRTPPKPVGHAPTFRASLGDGLEVASVPMHLGAVGTDRSASTLGNVRHPHGRRRELKDTKIHRVQPVQPAPTPEGLVLRNARDTNDSQGDVSLSGEAGSLAVSSAKPPTPPAYDLDLEKAAAAAESRDSTGRADLDAQDSCKAQHVGSPVSHRGPGFVESVS